MANVDTVDITKLILVEQGSTPSTPASGKDKLFVRASDHLLCLVDSSGTVTPYGGALTNPMTTAGDIIIGGASGTPTRLALATAGQVPTGTGSSVAAAYPPGHQMDRVEITSPVSVTATTEATAQIVVTSNSVTFDGSEYCFEFYSPYINPGTDAANRFLLLLLFDNTASTSASIGRLALVKTPVTGNYNLPCLVRRFLTPSAGARVHSVRAIVDGGTGTVQAGAAGTGAYMPAYLRITKA